MTPKPDARAALRDRVRIVLWGVGIVGAVQAASAYLVQNHVGSIIAQLVIVEFGTGRLGVAWSDPLAPMPTTRDIARRALRGVALGAAAAVVLVGTSVISHAAELAVGAFGIASLIIGLVVSVLVGARDELLLRGLVLRALGPNASLAARLVVCGTAGAAFRFGAGDVSWQALAFAFLSSVAFASLWLRDRGAWLAVGANAAFAFVTGPLAQGGLLDVRSKTKLDASVAAVACGVFFAASAIAWVRRTDSPPQSE